MRDLCFFVSRSLSGHCCGVWRLPLSLTRACRSLHPYCVAAVATVGGAARWSSPRRSKRQRRKRAPARSAQGSRRREDRHHGGCAARSWTLALGLDLLGEFRERAGFKAELGASLCSPCILRALVFGYFCRQKSVCSHSRRERQALRCCDRGSKLGDRRGEIRRTRAPALQLRSGDPRREDQWSGCHNHCRPLLRRRAL